MLPAAPPRTRLVLGAALLAVAAYAAAGAWSAERAGFPRTAAAQAVAALPLLAYLALALLAPSRLTRLLSWRARFDATAPGHAFAGALLVLTLSVIVGSALVAIAHQSEGGTVALPTRATDILLGSAGLAAFSLTTAWAWAHFVEGAKTRAQLQRALLLGGERPARNAGLGILLAALSLALILGFTALWARVAEARGAPAPDDAVARNLARTLGLWGILAATLLAAVHEEVLFRGLLAPRAGVIAQAVLFGLGHATYGTGLQVAATLLLGLLWGLVAVRLRSAWPTIVAHALFNLVGFLVAGEYA